MNFLSMQNAPTTTNNLYFDISTDKLKKPKSTKDHATKSFNLVPRKRVF